MAHNNGATKRTAATHVLLVLSVIAWCSVVSRVGGTEIRPCAEQPNTRSIVSEGLLRDMPDYLRAFCVQYEDTPGTASLAEPNELTAAIENSVLWIRAIVNTEYVPERIHTCVHGLVEQVNAYDATQVEFESHGLAFTITQTASHLALVVQPVSEGENASCVSAEQCNAYINHRMHEVITHAPVILAISDVVESVPSGVRIHRRTMNRDETKDLQKLREDLQKLDPTLPSWYGPGPGTQWFGTVSAMTDGHSLVVYMRKASGGAWMADHVKDWFRKTKLPGKYRRVSPQPPQRNRNGVSEGQ